MTGLLDPARPRGKRKRGRAGVSRHTTRSGAGSQIGRPSQIVTPAQKAKTPPSRNSSGGVSGARRVAFT